MHAQIKEVIKSIKFGLGWVSFDLSAGEQTPLGKLLFRLYYRSRIIDLVGTLVTGYPHNGGQHTLRFKGRVDDALAFLEMFKEEMLNDDTLTGESRQVANELSYISQEILAGKREILAGERKM